jgi:chemotaxis protein histidine kinase CheA
MSISDDEIRQAIAETFRVESDEHIQAMNRLLLRLEQGGVQDLPGLLDEIAREAHTLKGASSILGLTLIQETAHCLEEVFETLRDTTRDAPAELFDLLYAALDKLALGCQQVEDPVGEDAELLERLQAACRDYVGRLTGRPDGDTGRAGSLFEAREDSDAADPRILHDSRRKH